MPQSFADQLRSIPMSPNLGQSLERAHRSARDQSHRLVTLEHLLLALIEDSEASIILQSANVDLTRLGTDVSGYLGGLLEDMRAEPGTEPRPDSELLRVLQAAASAAQQSKRKQIDGAIVLAAVVGDGKSPAAGLLKALGMTFEEAIRALQRANAKARLKPIPKAEAASPVEPTRPAPAASPPPPKEPASAADPAADDLDILDPPSAEPVKPLMPQSADEILAAARARIQQRTSSASKPEPEPLQTPAAPRMPLAERATDTDPAPAEPIDPVHTKSLTAAIEAVMSHAPGRKTEPETRVEPPSLAAQSDGEGDQTRGQPSPGPPARAGDRVRAGWIPPPEANGRSEAAEMPAAVRAPLPPFPARPLRPNEGPRRPPLPQRLPAAGQPGRAARAPWPEPGEPGASSAPSLANGANADGAPHVLERLHPGARSGPDAGGQSDKGLLMEDVPRRMRVGRPAVAEVRIARDRVDGLLAVLNGREPGAPTGASGARALSVRLRGPKGGFWVEPATPETQWLEGRPARLDDGHVVWRWTIVPRRSGRSRLTLSVSAHTAGRDGATVPTPSSERPVEVKVGKGFLRRTVRMLGWLIAAAVGYAVASFGAEYWPMLAAALRSVLGA